MSAYNGSDNLRKKNVCFFISPKKLIKITICEREMGFSGPERGCFVPRPNSSVRHANEIT